jgi:hypothetical protein
LLGLSFELTVEIKKVEDRIGTGMWGVKKPAQEEEEEDREPI